ncbi:sensor histidine kinase [Bosea sp. (in: a-proteobacteria)]|jgi:two-component system C4-dicarboxylate transport sensor histidine kinase DctB|uniref:sensor histidine kinase n=1 Tax=Bosea sp. (in: a-proteobacteria) TaxID=1871050 RepID=UPI002DDCE936|nr:ATP-binding protein [Bosea sp. (in: a-proteobacteria)]HEV2508821.1 ATP-binding protein [Bosea sp. (in: a-proteobacteria)]
MNKTPSDERGRWIVRRRLWLVFALVTVAIATVAFLIAGDAGRGRAIAAMRTRAADAGTLALAILRGELEKQRALPVILARDPDVRSALRGADKHALDLKLEAIARETRAAVIYVLGKDGVAIAASNWREPTSFVGNDYAFRDYFSGAFTGGTAEQFALGTVSKRPGLYITSRVDDGGEPLGVVVVKIEFDQVEADWRALGGQTFAVDQRGVVLISTVTDWRFRTEVALSPQTAAEIRQSLQFGAAPLTLLPLRNDGEVVRGTGSAAGTHVASRIPIPTTDWQLEVLMPVGAAIRDEQVRLQTLVALLLMPGAALGAFALRRRQVNLARRNAEARVKAELERRVAERTLELAGANDRLVEEMAERTRAQERLSDAREELAKANRLATLGQVTAGVAHEINQPLAAMRTYAENARAFLVRADAAGADGALARIVGLTDRIGTITDTLRGFARRGGGPHGPVDLGEAIDGALMILDAALRQAGVTPKLPATAEPVFVLARLVELEQVFVNLMRNALEAMAEERDRRAPQLSIDVAIRGEQVDVAIIDNGPGLDDAALAALFAPFRTTKPRGLGLGLVISQDIVTSFGGTLSATSRPREGTIFTISLKRAA